MLTKDEAGRIASYSGKVSAIKSGPRSHVILGAVIVSSAKSDDDKPPTDRVWQQIGRGALSTARSR
jgi:hypothetical protein